MKRLGTGFAMALFVSALVASQAPGQDAKTLLETVSTAMGAGNLKTIEFVGSGVTFTHGQAHERFGPLPRFDVKSYRYTADYSTPGSRIERIRVQGSNPVRGGSPQPVIGEERTL